MSMRPTNKKVITNAVEYGIFLSVRIEIFGNKFYIASVNANCKNKVPCQHWNQIPYPEK